MKLLLTAILTTLLVACVPQNHNVPGNMIDRLDQDGNTKPGDGGVDVGPKGKRPRVYVLNKKSLVSIPRTQLVVSIPLGWKPSPLADGIDILNNDGSKVSITQASLVENNKPTLSALKQVLRAKHPDRHYYEIEINGLNGFKAEYRNAQGQTELDIYLISEENDYIQVRMNLQHKGMTIAAGHGILGSIRLEKAGTPKTVSLTKYVTIYAGLASAELPFEFAQTSATSLNVNKANKKTGYVIPVNHLTSTQGFDGIKATDDTITFESGHAVPADEIQNVLKSGSSDAPVSLERGGIYLVRTQGGLFQDIVAKIVVEAIEPGKAVRFKYQILSTVFIGIQLNQHPQKP